MPHHPKHSRHTKHVSHATHASHVVQRSGPGFYGDSPNPPPSPIGWTIAAVILILIVLAIAVMGICAVLEPVFGMFKSSGSTSKNTSSSLVRSTPPRNPAPTVSAATRREIGKIDRERERIQAQTALLNAKTAMEAEKIKGKLAADIKQLQQKGR